MTQIFIILWAFDILINATPYKCASGIFLVSKKDNHPMYIAIPLSRVTTICHNLITHILYQTKTKHTTRYHLLRVYQNIKKKLIHLAFVSAISRTWYLNNLAAMIVFLLGYRKLQWLVTKSNIFIMPIKLLTIDNVVDNFEYFYDTAYFIIE